VAEETARRFELLELPKVIFYAMLLTKPGGWVSYTGGRSV